jgi:hypothetical protein
MVLARTAGGYLEGFMATSEAVLLQSLLRYSAPPALTRRLHLACSPFGHVALLLSKFPPTFGNFPHPVSPVTYRADACLSADRLTFAQRVECGLVIGWDPFP